MTRSHPIASLVRLTPAARARHPEFAARVSQGVVAADFDGATKVIWGRGELVAWVKAEELERAA